jgi:hypothetical protein
VTEPEVEHSHTEAMVPSSGSGTASRPGGGPRAIHVTAYSESNVDIVLSCHGHGLPQGAPERSESARRRPGGRTNEIVGTGNKRLKANDPFRRYSNQDCRETAY